MEKHEKKTLPVLEYYQKTVNVYLVIGERTAEEVYQRVLQPARETYRAVRLFTGGNMIFLTLVF